MTPQSSAIVVLALSPPTPRTKSSLFTGEAQAQSWRAASSIGESRRQWLWRIIVSKLPPLPKTGIVQSELLRTRRPFDTAAKAATQGPAKDCYDEIYCNKKNGNRTTKRHSRTTAPHFPAAVTGAPCCEPARVGHG